MSQNGFNVCTRVAEKFGIRVSRIRLFFIYTLFVSFGLSFFLYLLLALFIKLKDQFFIKRKSVFDL
ncbi:PspC domain-containing protein [Bacteroidetes bacterium endosymbiont of Geopemphigus sp.]